jgi:WD40 repeat protein
MGKLPKAKPLLKLQWQSVLSEYVTAIAWSPRGKLLAASSASGEIMLYNAISGHTLLLQPGDGQSIGGLAFSADGQWLASGGQDSTLRIWHIPELSFQTLDPPVCELAQTRGWIDRLQWHPLHAELAWSVGREVRVWDVGTQEIETCLQFATSSVLDLAWHPQGTHLAVSGNQAIKIWQHCHWENEPTLWETSAPTITIAWAEEGRYLAAGNADHTLLVWQWGNPYPWQMQGFAGKVRQLAWSTSVPLLGTPLLASISNNDIIVWDKSTDASIGWDACLLDLHRQKMTAIAFQPKTFLLAAASADGWLSLWQDAKEVSQILQGAPEGFSCLAWHPQGQHLAAGGQRGEILVWELSQRAQGFSRQKN